MQNTREIVALSFHKNSLVTAKLFKIDLSDFFQIPCERSKVSVDFLLQLKILIYE